VTVRTLTLGLLLAVAAPTYAQAPPKAEANPTVVPFTLLPSRHMLLEVKVNGKGPYKLIFDTGAPINLISSRLAKDAGLVKKGKGGGGFSLLGGLNQLDVDKLEVGGVAAEKLPAVVMDHPTVKAISDAFEDEYGVIDGIVGFPFFGRFSTTIDYQKKEMAFTPTDYKPGDYLGDLTRNLMSAADRKAEPKVVGAAGLWGFAVAAADDDRPGVVVTKVHADGPAARAGLKADDRVLTIDGRWADTVADAYLAASLVRPGREVAVVVKRDGKEVTVKVTPTKGY
jgi:hypothetical protein